MEKRRTTLRWIFLVAWGITFTAMLLKVDGADNVELNRLSVFAATIAAFTGFMLIMANQDAIDISRKMLEMERTPHVALWLDSNAELPFACDLVVKNIGRGPAYGIRISFVTGSRHFSNPMYHSRQLVDHGIKFMAPGREIRDMLAGMQYMPPKAFRMAVAYYPTKELRPEDRIEEQFEMNPWEAVKGETDNKDTKALTEIAHELKRMNDRQTTWRVVGESEVARFRRRLRRRWRMWRGR